MSGSLGDGYCLGEIFIGDNSMQWEITQIQFYEGIIYVFDSEKIGERKGFMGLGYP
jgi:hypothetical protein